MLSEARSLEIRNHGGEIIDVGVEPLGMFYALDLNRSMVIRSNFGKFNELEVVRHGAGISVWILGSAEIFDESGGLLDKIPAVADPGPVSSGIDVVIHNETERPLSAKLNEHRVVLPPDEAEVWRTHPLVGHLKIVVEDGGVAIDEV